MLPPLPRSKRKLFFLLLVFGLPVSGAVMLVLAKVHEEIAQPALERFDQQGLVALHARDTPGLTRLAFALSFIGSPTMIVCAIGLGALALWSSELRRDATLLVVAVGGSSLLDTALKVHFRRVRPDVPWAFVTERSFSFPSGHSVVAVVFYGVLTYLLWEHLHALWQRVAVVAASLVLIAGIGASRVYLGVHYPTDVAAGYLVGLLWLAPVIAAHEYVKAGRANRAAPG